MISISFAPNIQFDDFIVSVKSLRMLFSSKKKYSKKVCEWFLKHFPGSKNTYLFSSAREAEYFFFKNIHLKKGDQVAVQAFTCSAVIYPILWCEAKPVYIDIDEKNLGMDPTDLEKKITKNVKAVIMQHTFGLPAKSLAIKEICKKNNISLIEDCAHIIDPKSTQKVGKIGDVTLFSFGREKVVSSHVGGMLMVNNDKFTHSFDSLYQKVENASKIKQFHSLLYIAISYKILLIFRASSILAKMLFYLSKTLRILDTPVNENKNLAHLSKIGEVNARLILNQLNKLSKMNSKRREISNMYFSGGLNTTFKIQGETLLRVPVLVKNRDNVMNKFSDNDIYIGDWYSHVIDPKSTSLQEMGYTKGMCRIAEGISDKIINLPCNPTMKISDAREVLEKFKRYV